MTDAEEIILRQQAEAAPLVADLTREYFATIQRAQADRAAAVEATAARIHNDPVAYAVANIVRRAVTTATHSAQTPVVLEATAAILALIDDAGSQT